MPLNDFNDYDDYWKRRVTQGVSHTVIPRYTWVAERIPDGDSVIDIGCGDGAFLAYLKSRNPASPLFGIDISEEAISHLKERGIDGVRTDGTIPLRKLVDRDFDIVVLMEVLEHMSEAEAFFKEVLALNPKRIFVSIPNVGYLPYRLRLMFGGRFPATTILYHIKEHLRFWTVNDFRQWAGVMGCDVARCAGQENSRSAFGRFLARRFPSLFSYQVIYELTPKAI